MDAVVNTPIPVKASLTATALDPKIMHKKTVNIPALSESSWLAGCVSVILLIFMQNSGGNYTTRERLARRYHRKKIQTY
jgi:hypothetical protein